MVFTGFFIIPVAVSGFGLLVGFLLNWMMSSIGLGSGAIVGALATGLSVYFTVRLTEALGEHAPAEEKEEHAQAEEKEGLEDLLIKYQAARKSRSRRR